MNKREREREIPFSTKIFWIVFALLFRVGTAAFTSVQRSNKETNQKNPQLCYPHSFIQLRGEKTMGSCTGINGLTHVISWMRRNNAIIWKQIRDSGKRSNVHKRTSSMGELDDDDALFCRVRPKNH